MDTKDQESHMKRVHRVVILLFGSKWRVDVLCAVEDGPRRFGQLKRQIPGISKKSLISNLRTLEREEIVSKRIVDGLVKNVEYRLSEANQGFILDVLQMLDQWGRKHLKDEQNR